MCDGRRRENDKPGHQRAHRARQLQRVRRDKVPKVHA
jgi:hypothetical protein